MERNERDESSKEVPPSSSEHPDLPDLEFWPQLEFDPENLQNLHDWLEHPTAGPAKITDMAPQQPHEALHQELGLAPPLFDGSDVTDELVQATIAAAAGHPQQQQPHHGGGGGGGHLPAMMTMMDTLVFADVPGGLPIFDHSMMANQYGISGNAAAELDHLRQYEEHQEHGGGGGESTSSEYSILTNLR